jgi:hydrogenase maturation protease
VDSGFREGARLLVIGYGNELRRDDGVGAKVAAAVAEWNLSGVHAIGCHQLTPELTEAIASASHVVFVDAALDAGGSVQCREIEPDENSQVMTHAIDPHSLLKLAKQAFGRCPIASWLTIPVEDVDFGEELSPLARQGLKIALEKIRALAEAICR